LIYVTPTPTSASGLRALALASGSPTPSGAPEGPALDEFQASSPDKNRKGFEAAYTAASAVSLLAQGAARTGQVYALAGAVAGLPAWSLSGPLALAAGTIDVAVGASQGRRAAVNRDAHGALKGSLQLFQGLATYAAVAAPALGAPALLGTLAGGVAAAALVGRVGVAAHEKFQERKQAQADQELQPPSPPTQEVARPAETSAFANAEDLGEVGGSRKFEKAFAFSQANDQFVRGVGGMGAMWNTVESIRGNPPKAVFGMLGMVGGTVSLLDGINKTRASAINRYLPDTVSGALQTVQGAATMAVSMGLGRPAAIVAAGAWVANTAWSVFSQVRAVTGEDGGKEKPAPAPPKPPAPPAPPED